MSNEKETGKIIAEEEALMMKEKAIDVTVEKFNMKKEEIATKLINKILAEYKCKLTAAFQYHPGKPFEYQIMVTHDSRS